MNYKNKSKYVLFKSKVGGVRTSRLSFRKRCHCRNQIVERILLVIFLIAILLTAICLIKRNIDNGNLERQQQKLVNQKINIAEEFKMPTAGIASVFEENNWSSHELSLVPKMLPEYSILFEQNPHIVGWLKIDDTVIDYPVMQTIEDEDYYLDYDFYGKKNINGSLILDTDSVAGVGTSEMHYKDEMHPTTNLIIHGHTMKSGHMFGNLNLYKDEDYGSEHGVICFDSLYEKREYELIAVFYSQVYFKNQDVFKYYNFFQADTQEQFDNWYENIKEMSLYDTDVRAEFGDEFITLSCCSYQVEDGRFVVVGKRIK
jgi:sortase B